MSNDNKMNPNNNDENMQELDFESFFGEFEDFEAPAEEKPAAFDPDADTGEEIEPTEAAVFDPEAGDRSFLDDTRRDIDAMLSEFAADTAPEESEPELSLPSPETKTVGGFSITIPDSDIDSDSMSGIESFAPAASARQPSVSYSPEAGTGFDPIDLGYGAKAAPQQEEQTEKEEKEKAKKKSSFFPSKGDSGAEKIRKTVFILAILTIIVSVGVLVNTYFIDPYLAQVKNEQASEALTDAVVPEGTPEYEMWDKLQKENPDVEFPAGMLIKYATLYAANPDLSGWITIDGLSISLPLAQGEDNSYYLKRNIYKKRTDYGVPYFDYRNELYFLDRNTVVYGHNMRYSDLIFGMLEDYKTVDGFKKAPTIQCNTIYEDYTWKLYAVYISNSEAKDDNGYVFNYTFTRLNDEKFMSYIDEVDKRALYKTGVDINETDSILTLSTCCYDFDSAKIVVVARLLRNGESADVDTSLAQTNPNPKYPQAWYDANGKTNPYANDEKWYA